MSLTTSLVRVAALFLTVAAASHAQTGSLAAPPIPGVAESFGRAVDADGELIVVASDISASIVNLANGRFEARDLLATLPAGDITRVLDVAIEGDRAAVFVERASGALPAEIHGFQRSAPGGAPTWLPTGFVAPLPDLLPQVTEVHDFRGALELRHGTLVAAFSYADDVLEVDTGWVMFFSVTPGGFDDFAAQVADGARLRGLSVGAPIGWFGTRDEVGVNAGFEFVGDAGWELLDATLSLGASAPGLGADLSFASSDALVVGASGAAGVDGSVAWFELP